MSELKVIRSEGEPIHGATEVEKPDPPSNTITADMLPFIKVLPFYEVRKVAYQFIMDTVYINELLYHILSNVDGLENPLSFDDDSIRRLFDQLKYGAELIEKGRKNVSLVVLSKAHILVLYRMCAIWQTDCKEGSKEHLMYMAINNALAPHI